MKIEEVVAFTEFLGKMSAIKRTVKLKATNDYENDAEHSFQVALMSWYIAYALKIPVNMERLLGYALVHDLVEIHAGDTDPFKSSKEYVDSKEAREKEALKTIKDAFPLFPSLPAIIEGYEALADEESAIVHFVDKMLPDINTWLAHDPYYRDNKVTHEAWRKWIDGKIEKAGIKDERMKTLVNDFLAYAKETANFYPSP